MKKSPRPLLFFIQGLAAGALGSLLLLYLVGMYATIGADTGTGTTVLKLLHWCRSNLGLSLIAFGLCATLFAVCLSRLVTELRQDQPEINRVESLDKKLDLLANLFFGIGVIWTAIGMRNAMLVSLGGLDAATAQRLGAFVILQRLVDGGMLIALSTTIFGAIGGYILRMIKLWVAGPALAALYERIDNQVMQGITGRLDTIAGLLHECLDTGKEVSQ